jgi:hypothetical protein
MTAENDGLPLAESTAHGSDETGVGPRPATGDSVADQPLDPPTDLLPLDAVTAARVAATEAATRQVAVPVTPPPTAAESAPDTTTHGTLEGDLFDDQVDQ